MPHTPLNLTRVRNLIRELPDISAWELIRERKKRYERYLTFDRPECQRVVEKEQFTVVLYRIREEEGRKVLGESVVVLSEGDPLQEKLAQGLEMASLVANPVFHLPEKGLTYEKVRLFDPEVRQDPLACLDRIQEDLLRPKLPHVRRSSLEIFLEERDLQLINSNGLEVGEPRSEFMVDFVLLSEKGPSAEGECQGIRRAVFREDLHLPEMLERYARYAREAGEAVLPRSGVYPVIFAEEALDHLFHFFCLQASGPARFQQWSHLKRGEPVIDDLKGEPLTLASHPGLPGGLKSRSFDANGLPLRRVVVIADNIFQRPMNSKRYADYLQEEATGDFTNLEVTCGAQPFRELQQDGPLYLLLRFSHFEPHPVSGAFSGEIRTGYFLRNGKYIPIKGGSVSGSIQQAFREVYFSRERTRRETYEGPQAVRMESVTVAGE